MRPLIPTGCLSLCRVSPRIRSMRGESVSRSWWHRCGAEFDPQLPGRCDSSARIHLARARSVLGAVQARIVRGKLERDACLVAQPACRRYAATGRQLRPPIVARLPPRRDDAGEWLAGSHWLVGCRLASDRLQFGPGYPIRIRWVVLVDPPRTIFFCYYKSCPKH